MDVIVVHQLIIVDTFVCRELLVKAGAIDLYPMILSSFYLDHVLIDQYYIYNRIHLCLSSSLQIWNTSEKAAPELSTDKQACIAGVRGGRALFLFVCCESFEAYKH